MLRAIYIFKAHLYIKRNLRQSQHKQKSQGTAKLTYGPVAARELHQKAKLT